MKVGTLVSSDKWSKGIVTEILTIEVFYDVFNPIQICWLNPKTRESPVSIVWHQKQITIISEGE